MDLAKIRQKARQEQENRLHETSLPVQVEAPDRTVPREKASIQQSSAATDYFQNVEPLNLPNVFPENPPALPTVPRLVRRDPLETIMAGRETAGCGDSLPLMSDAQTVSKEDIYQKFLCFKVSNEVYGIDIMDIKELIKPREVTEVPRAPSFVSGIISLRGVIIPIIDLLDRLSLARAEATGRERVVVVRQGESFCGLLVDEIIQVVRIAKDDIEAAPTVLEGIDRDFVTGIGRADDRMVILLNLTNIIDIHLY